MDERYEFSEGGMRLLILEISFPTLPEGVAGERLGAFLLSAVQAVRQSAEDAIPRLFFKVRKRSRSEKALSLPSLRSFAFLFHGKEKKILSCHGAHHADKGRPHSFREAKSGTL